MSVIELSWTAKKTLGKDTRKIVHSDNFCLIYIVLMIGRIAHQRWGFHEKGIIYQEFAELVWSGKLPDQKMLQFKI